MSDLHPGQTDPVAPAPAPDMLAELGPLAYGLFALAEPGELAEVSALADSIPAWVPPQAERVADSDTVRQQALLGELGSLDL